MQNGINVNGGRATSCKSPRLRKAIGSLGLAVAATIGSLFAPGGAQANTADNVSSGQTDLTASGSYSGGSPGTSSDVDFTNVSYSPTAFTLNTNAFNLNIGTLDDLDATQTLSIDNTNGSGNSTITLNGGNNSVSGIAGDLLYVASGGNLVIGNASTGAVNLALASGGNFDIAGTAAIASVISDSGSGFTKTGVGTLTLSNANTYPGNTTVSAGTLTLTGSLSSTVLNLAGGTLTYSEPDTNSQSFTTTAINSGQSAIKNTVSTDTLNLGSLTQTVGATVFLTKTGNISTSTTTAQDRIAGDNNLGGWIVIDNGNNTYDWANSGTSGVNNITAVNYVSGSTGNTGNVRYTSGTTSLNVNASWVSINLQGSSTVLNINGTQVYLDTGGIILSGGATLGGSKPVKCNEHAFYIHVPDSGTISTSLQNNGATAAALYKDGPGVLALTGANSYSGTTTINGGAIRANNTSGSATGSGAIAVNSGGTLGGSGTIGNGTNAITVASGGILTAGANATTIGTLTTGAQTWNGGGKLLAQLAGSNSGDLVNITSTGSAGLTLASSTGTTPFTVTESGTAASLSTTMPETWTLATFTGSSTGTPSGYTGTLPAAAAGATVPVDSQFMLDTSTLATLFNGSETATPVLNLEYVSSTEDALQLSYNATPEPGTAMLVLGGMLPMLTGRRRRRQSVIAK
jgi:fibronectin-binding autotransporter adhesin